MSEDVRQRPERNSRREPDHWRRGVKVMVIGRYRDYRSGALTGVTGRPSVVIDIDVALMTVNPRFISLD
ncbi:MULTISPECIES: hypothetical protein [unclassified Pantoea]|uniref:hypothetical protein n=1 Tax=unclassified Pantoea TaxID=2630326 RepID=UPI002556582A|nr:MULTISPECIES: hypothetical protein [unclassified Pantoea]